MNTRNVVMLTGYYPAPEKMGKIFMYKEGDGDKKSVLRSKINVKRAFKNKNGENEYDWLPFTAFGHNADYINNYIHEGDIFQITGELRISENYEKDGKTIYGQPFVMVDAVSIVSSNNSEGSASSNGDSEKKKPAAKKTASPSLLSKFRKK